MSERMTQASKSQLRAWKRRAETIERNAAALLSDILAVTGPEDPMTDEADNTMVSAQDLCGVIERQMVRQGCKP